MPLNTGIFVLNVDVVSGTYIRICYPALLSLSLSSALHLLILKHLKHKFKTKKKNF